MAYSNAYSVHSFYCVHSRRRRVNAFLFIISEKLMTLRVLLTEAMIHSKFRFKLDFSVKCIRYLLQPFNTLRTV